MKIAYGDIQICKYWLIMTDRFVFKNLILELWEFAFKISDIPLNMKHEVVTPPSAERYTATILDIIPSQIVWQTVLR